MHFLLRIKVFIQSPLKGLVRLKSMESSVLFPKKSPETLINLLLIVSVIALLISGGKN